MTVKILDCLGGGTAAGAAEGLLYAAHMGARVANLSFGADGDSITLTNAIREASQRLRHGHRHRHRQRRPFVGDVPGALARGPRRRLFRNPQDPRALALQQLGPEVDVAAPGLNIISTVPANFCNVTWLCVQNTPYALASGTSVRRAPGVGPGRPD